MFFNKRRKSGNHDARKKRHDMDRMPCCEENWDDEDLMREELMEHYQDYMEEFGEELSVFYILQEMEKDREMLEDEQ